MARSKAKHKIKRHQWNQKRKRRLKRKKQAQKEG